MAGPGARQQLVAARAHSLGSDAACARKSTLPQHYTAQPALALAHKVVQRVIRAGLPADLIPAEITTITVTADADAENTLRTAVLEFIDTVRSAEKAIAADRRGEDVPAELDVAPVGVITEEEWRAHWLPAVGALVAEDELDEPEAPEGDPREPVDEADDAVDEPAEESQEPDAETDTSDDDMATGESADKDEDSSDDQSKKTEPQ